MKRVISLLGKASTGKYRETRYHFRGEDWEPTCYFGLELARRTNADDLVLLGTAGSMWDVLLLDHLDGEIEAAHLELERAARAGSVCQEQLDGLAPLIERAVGRPVVLRLIGLARTAREQMAILADLAALVEPGDEILLDVTHGFRHLAMLALAAAAYLRQARRVRLEGLVYGAFEMAADNGGVAPVIELNGLADLLGWVESLAAYQASGNLACLEPSLIRSGMPEGRVEGLRQAAFHERNLDTARAADEVRRIPELMRQLDSPAGGLYLPELERNLAWVAGGERWRREAALAAQQLERGDWVRAAALLTEAAISRSEPGAVTYAERDAASRALGDAREPQRPGSRRPGPRHRAPRGDGTAGGLAHSSAPAAARAGALPGARRRKLAKSARGGAAVYSAGGMSSPRPTRASAATAYPRILLAVTGLSPQVITETVYALAREGGPLPTAVHALTTQEGAERLRLTLLGSKPGWFGRLCREYQLRGIEFRESHIHVLRDARGRSLADIRTPRENTLLADQITDLVRRFTADPASALHVSIAGGRKTMGFYAGYALSLFGRPQDRLSHVLVPPKFESNPDFFYPSPAPRTIYDRDRRPLDAATAAVTLADIPFVRMRDMLGRELLRGGASFSGTVEALNRARPAASLVIMPERRRLRAGGCEFTLPHREMAFYLWLARRRLAGRPGVSLPDKDKHDLELAAEYRQEYTLVRDDEDDELRTARRLKPGMNRAFFAEVKARLQRALVTAGVTADYHVQRQKNGGRAGEFTLGLPPEVIVIEAPGSRPKVGS